MYIHELENWPKFFWNNDAITQLLLSLRYQQGCLIGGMQSVGFKYSEESVLQTLTQDVVKSSEIEGEILDGTAVRSSIARHLGMDIGALSTPDRHVDGVVEMTLDATQNFDQLLTKERIFNWHASLFPTGRSGFTKIQVATWRSGPVQVVSGRMGKEIVHFEGPSGNRVDHEMTLFLDWYNHETSVDPVLKAALAHLWFVTIHPFEDGNGRIGRAIADMMLTRSENSARRFYSLSAQIQRERKGYYAILESTQKNGLDVTAWLEWFFASLGRAIETARSTLEMLLYKTRFFDAFRDVSLNDRQRKVINLLLEKFEGKLTSSKWAKLTKCSQDTAHRDILYLLDKGILTKSTEQGRSTNYNLVHIHNFDNK